VFTITTIISNNQNQHENKSI